ncbi:MAG TPA: hypothetical protein VF752_10535 [Thermoleophilaceae bacterium]
MRKARIAGTTVAVAAVAMAVAGYATSVADSGGAGAAAARPKPTVALRTTSLGKILVDGKTGRTLYEFGKDRRNKSNCSGSCAAIWPPLTVSGKLLAGKGVSASKLTTIKRADGKRQAVYAGHPLYRFAADSKAGQTNGEGVNGFGGLWYAMNARGSLVKGPPPSQPMNNPYGY